MPAVTIKEDLLEYLIDYNLPKLSGLLREIVLDYTSRNIKSGFTPAFEDNLPGIVMLLEYLSCCEKSNQENGKM